MTAPSNVRPLKQGPTTTAVAFKKGDTIVRENEIDKDMYIIRKGNVLITRTYLGHKIELARLGTGEIFGEFSFFDGAPRSATVTALEPVLLFKISRSDEQRVLEDLPPWVSTVMKCVFSRFRELDTKLAALLASNEVSQKHFSSGNALERLYRELSRLLEIVLIAHEKLTKKGTSVRKVDYVKEVESLVGMTHLNFSVLWLQLERLSLLQSNSTAESFGINTDLVSGVIHHLQEHIQNENYLYLSGEAWALLRQLMTTSENTASKEELKKQQLNPEQPEIKELVKYGLLKQNEQNITWEEETVFYAYTIQSLLSSFRYSFK